MRLWAHLAAVILAGILLLPASAAWASDQQTFSRLEFAPGQQVPPRQYGHDVCTAVREWDSNIKNAEQTLKSDLSGASTGSEAKDAVVNFLGTAAQGTDAMLAEVHAAGVPRIKNGTSVQRFIESQLTDLRSLFASAQEAAAQLSTTDPAQFRSSVSKIGKTLNRGSKKVAQAFKRAKRKYESANRALDDPACHS